MAKPGVRNNKPKAQEKRRNQRSFLSKLDGRTQHALVLKGRLEQLTTDLGGADRLSYQQLSLCERAIFIEKRLIELEDEYAKGMGFDAAEHIPALQLLASIYKMLGLKRVAKDVKSLRTLIQEAETP